MGFDTSLAKLSSGLRINTAADDPAGLVLSNELAAQVTGINQSVTNAQNSISLIQTAEGAMTEMSSLLNSMRGLALDAANTGVVDAATVSADQAQVNAAVTSLNQIAQTTTFAGRDLLNGTGSNQATITNGIIKAASAGTSAPVAAAYVSVVISTAAAYASVTGSNQGAATYAAADTLWVNGVQINIANGEGHASAIGQINIALNAAGVAIVAASSAATAHAIVFKTTGYGSAAKITMQDSSHSIVSGGAQTGHGTDIAGTLNYTSGATAVNGLTATGTGLTLVGSQGALNGLSMTFASTETASTYHNAVYVTPGQLTFQVGPNSGDTVTTSIPNMQATNLALTTGGATGLESIMTGGTYNLTANPSEAISVIDEAINDVSTQDAALGSLQQYTLNATVTNLGVANENTQAARAQVLDVDMASETSTFTSDQILMQAATSMIAQANSAPQLMLKLLS